jgi:plasmid stabilization system protein ParE
MILDILPEARAALERIYKLTAVERPQVAAEKAILFDKKFQMLRRRPNIGRPGKRPNTRELSVNPWVIVYRVIEPKDEDDEGILQIINIWDSRQNRRSVGQ